MKADDNEVDKPTRSFSSERQCAYKAFSGAESEEGTLPEMLSALCSFFGT